MDGSSIQDVETVLLGENMSADIYQSFTNINTGLLYQMNESEVRSLYPLIFFYAAILIIGVLGNALVLLVYSFRYKRSPARVYILFLAAIDFSMCFFGLPYHLIDMTHPYTYTNAVACKSLTFIITTLFHSSVFGLIVIAIDRYLKICKPLGKVQIAYFGKKRACSAAVVIGLLMSWPNIVLYGPSEMEGPVANITGHSCFFETQFLETNYPFIYVLTTLTICVLSTVFLIVAYSLICHQIITRYKAQNIKITGKSAFDDTTITEELILRNCGSSAQDVSNITSKQYCSKSAEDINRLDKASITYFTNYRSASDDHDLSLYDGNLVVCNSNGSLTFIGDRQYRNALGEGRSSEFHTDETSKPLLPRGSVCSDSISSISKRQSNVERNSTGSKLKHTANKGASFRRKTNQIMQVFDNISKTQERFFIPDNLNVNRKCQSNDRLDKQIKTGSLQDIENARISNGARKDGRYSLQVPSGFDGLRKKLSVRRISDETGIQRGGSQEPAEGLRIHTSSQTIAIVSRQGTFKGNKTIPKQHSKVTKIMLSITLIFILSYAPALVVTIWTCVNPEFWDLLDQNETIICEFFLRFYLVNNICNPFIYGFWDKRFKREIIYTFRKLKYLLHTKCSCKCLK